MTIPEDFTGRKTTPTEFAKRAVAEWGTGAEYWFERVESAVAGKVTTHESKLIDSAVTKQLARVRGFLGLEEAS